MKRKTKNREVIIFIILIIVIIGGIIILNYLDLEQTTSKSSLNKKPELKELCFYYQNKTQSGFYNKSWLKLNILDNVANGEFYNLPAEKNPEVGPFEGAVRVLSQKTISYEANVWWNLLGEGIKIKEKLLINFSNNSRAKITFKDENNLYQQKTMSQISCGNLNEKLNIEIYIKDNINNIATNKPVLGGTWSLSQVEINPFKNQGSVTYEDGHIQSKATFNYIYEKFTDKVKITKFNISN